MNNEESSYIQKYIQDITSRTIPLTYNPLPHPILWRTTYKIRNGFRIQIYGRPASAKTSLAISICLWNIATKNGRVLWVDSSYSFPEEYIITQIPENMEDKFYITRSYTESFLKIASTVFSTIVIDDTTCLNDKTREHLSKISVVCARNACDLILISQVRRDIFGTKDLVPDTAIANCDVVFNIVRSEMIDENSSKFRYTLMTKSLRGQMKDKNMSVECDYIGINLIKILLQDMIDKQIITKSGLSMTDIDNNIFKTRNQLFNDNRFNYEWIIKHAKLLYEQGGKK